MKESPGCWLINAGDKNVFTCLGFEKNKKKIIIASCLVNNVYLCKLLANIKSKYMCQLVYMWFTQYKNMLL